MLQRMQTLWFLFAGICAFLSIRLSFYGGNLEVPNQAATYQYLNAAFNIWILIITIGLICVSVIDIFLYRLYARDFALLKLGGTSQSACESSKLSGQFAQFAISSSYLS